MSSPLHDENGAFGESDAPPNVYLPHVDATVPSYDGYVDPAAAHGWQNAYDETRELPPVRDDGVAGAGAGAGTGTSVGAGVGRAELRRQGGRRSRGVVVAVGALLLVCVAALVVGFAVSGTSSHGSPGKGDRTSATTGSTAGRSTGGGVRHPFARGVRDRCARRRFVGVRAALGLRRGHPHDRGIHDHRSGRHFGRALRDRHHGHPRARQRRSRPRSNQAPQVSHLPSRVSELGARP